MNCEVVRSFNEKIDPWLESIPATLGESRLSPQALNSFRLHALLINWVLLCPILMEFVFNLCSELCLRILELCEFSSLLLLEICSV